MGVCLLAASGSGSLARSCLRMVNLLCPGSFPPGAAAQKNVELLMQG